MYIFYGCTFFIFFDALPNNNKPPYKKVDGCFYVNDKLAELMIEELRQFSGARGVGGFLPAIKQIANVAALPGIVGVSWCAARFSTQNAFLHPFFVGGKMCMKECSNPCLSDLFASELVVASRATAAMITCPCVTAGSAARAHTLFARALVRFSARARADVVSRSLPL